MKAAAFFSAWRALPSGFDTRATRHAVGRLGGMSQQPNELDPMLVWSALSLLLFGLISGRQGE